MSLSYSTYTWCWKLLLWLLLAVTVLAQKRGPITIYLVNDSDDALTAVFLNQLRVVDGELIPERTGPILPHTVEQYKAYPYDGIELHQASDECGTRKGTSYNPTGQCKSQWVKVRKANGDYPTNVIVMAPNFVATSETLLNPSHLIQAMRENIAIDASIRIINHSGRPATLFWVIPNDNNKLVPMADAPIGSREDPHYFHASVYHQFQLQEVCGDTARELSETKEKYDCLGVHCSDDGLAGRPPSTEPLVEEEDKAQEECGVRYFRVTAKEIEITISPNFQVEWKQIPYDPFSKFTYQPDLDLFQQCHDHVRPEMHFEHPDKIKATIDKCIRNHWDPHKGANLQSYIDYKMEEYVCEEPRMQTTAPVEIELWSNPNEQHKMRTVFVLHETESSRIHLISSFISPEECQAIEQVASGKYQGTKTADGKGGYKPNLIRKAEIARVDVPWESADSPIAKTGRRIFDYVQHIHPELEITHEGQEPLMAIQYQGRGKDDPYPDRYKSHCDSDCNGQPVKEGQRVATMVMYCEMPKEGGHTNFRSAHVHVKPQPGNAIFFSYVNPATKEQDDGQTIHAGCPVYEGTKKIVTQWIRYGVDWENPYTDFGL